MTRRTTATALVVAASMLAAIGAAVVARSGGGGPVAASAPAGSGALVVDWNRELLRIVRTSGAQPATVHPTRSFAILHGAIYDAVLHVARDARADAAAAQAGHDTLAALYPARAGELDSQLAGELNAIPDGAPRQQGVDAGRRAAQRLLAARAADGSATPPPPLPPGTAPGDYRPTPPGFARAAFTHWASVTPFVLEDAAQFRPEPPPQVSSQEYLDAVAEVRDLGRDSSTTRSAEQTVAARFWSAPIWNYWNEIAQRAALDHHTGLVRTARLFAGLNLAFADGVIAFYDAKYHDHVWRPVTAIRQDDTGWTPLVATPADPSYPGAHSVISAAAETVLSRFFGAHTAITVSSELLPGVSRSFPSFQDAALEAGLSRIWAGVHTRIDHEAGLRLGHQVAGFVMEHAMSG
jgi:hypothetical protein